MIKVPTIEVVLFIMNEAHNDQPRMNGSPYWPHCLRGLDILRNKLGVKSDVTDQAMLVHDVAEDCLAKGFNLNYLRNRFGFVVADLAHWVCKPPRPPEADKLVFCRGCYRKIAQEAPYEAQQMKIADRLENLSDPYNWSANFKTRYCQDTANLIEEFANVNYIHLVADRLKELQAV